MRSGRKFDLLTQAKNNFNLFEKLHTIWISTCTVDVSFFLCRLCNEPRTIL